MAFVRMAFFPKADETHYRALARALEGAPVPDARRLFAAGPVDEGWWVVQVWDDKEQLDAFNSAWLFPALERTERPFPEAPRVTDFEALDSRIAP